MTRLVVIGLSDLKNFCDEERNLCAVTVPCNSCNDDMACPSVTAGPRLLPPAVYIATGRGGRSQSSRKWVWVCR